MDAIKDYFKRIITWEQLIEAIEKYFSNTWHPMIYDGNYDGKLTKPEVVNAIQDYFDYSIEKWQVINVIQRYFA
jgi:hypothetical protein